MKRFAIWTVVLLTVFSRILCAQEVLTNDSIIKLMKAGLSEELIVQTVNSQPGNYSLGTDDIVSLKKAHVSEKVIAAMLNKGHSGGRTPGGVGPELTNTGYPSEIGIYVKTNNRWVEVEPEVVNWKTGGVFKHIASGGIIKGDVNGNIDGRESRNKVSTPLEFCIYAPEGAAITEYQLLHLRLTGVNNYREFRTITGGVLHEKGGTTRDQMAYQSTKVASRTFLITLSSVQAGEYGFLPPGVLTSGSSSSTLGKMYTFSVVE